MSKSFMAVRHCYSHVDLVSYLLYLYSSNISISLRNIITFSTSALDIISVVFFHWGAPRVMFDYISLYFLHAAFVHVGWWSFRKRLVLCLLTMHLTCCSSLQSFRCHLLFFFLLIYTARSSAQNDPSNLLPSSTKMPLIATRKSYA